VSKVLSSTNLADLSDVDLTAPAAGSLLQFSGGRWVDVVPNLDLLADVSTSGGSAPTDGQALLYDSASGLWQPGTVAGDGGGGGPSGSALVASVKYGSGATVVVPSGGAKFGPATAYPDLVFTLAAAATVQIESYLYLLTTTLSDFCFAISPDNWATSYLLDAYSGSQPPEAWRVQYAKLRVLGESNYQTPFIPAAILALPAGDYRVRLWKLTTTGGWTAAENAGYASVKRL
jgi:hypothetical protein